MQAIKKPLHLSQGHRFFAHSPHLADCSAGIGTFSCYIARRLPGFIGPFPSTSLDESSYSCTYSVFKYRLFSKYTQETG
jgi:hypothetical protein